MRAALALFLTACSGPVPTDAEAPAMTTEQYRDHAEMRPLVAGYLVGAPDLNQAIRTQAAANVARDPRLSVEAEVARITVDVTSRARALQSQQAAADCASRGVVAVGIGPIGAAVALGAMVGGAVAQADCVSQYRAAGVEPRY